MKVVTLLQPYLQGKDAGVVPLIRQREAAVDNLLTHFKATPGYDQTGYVEYSTVTEVQSQAALDRGERPGRGDVEDVLSGKRLKGETHDIPGRRAQSWIRRGSSLLPTRPGRPGRPAAPADRGRAVRSRGGGGQPDRVLRRFGDRVRPVRAIPAWASRRSRSTVRTGRHHHPGPGPAGVRHGWTSSPVPPARTCVTCCGCGRAAAARMTAGQVVGRGADPGAPPVDTGEAAARRSPA